MDKMKDQEQKSWAVGLRLVSELTAWVAIPVVIAVYFGKWLDQKFNTGPWLFLATVGAAFVISNVGIIRQSMKSMKRIEAEVKKKQDIKKK